MYPNINVSWDAKKQKCKFATLIGFAVSAKSVVIMQNVQTQKSYFIFFHFGVNLTELANWKITCKVCCLRKNKAPMRYEKREKEIQTSAGEEFEIKHCKQKWKKNDSDYKKEKYVISLLIFLILHQPLNPSTFWKSYQSQGSWSLFSQRHFSSF